VVLLSSLGGIVDIYLLKRKRAGQWTFTTREKTFTTIETSAMSLPWRQCRSPKSPDACRGIDKIVGDLEDVIKHQSNKILSWNV